MYLRMLGFLLSDLSILGWLNEHGKKRRGEEKHQWSYVLSTLALCGYWETI